jgi:RNA polymerase sigma-B factor
MRARSAELFARLREDGATEAERSHYRDQLVHLHLPLVEHFARRFLNRGEPFDDLLAKIDEIAEIFWETKKS